MAIKLIPGEIVFENVTILDNQRDWIFHGYIKGAYNEEECDCVVKTSDEDSYGGSHYSKFLFPKFRRCVLVEKYKESKRYYKSYTRTQQ
jgi:hypothetical protein